MTNETLRGKRRWPMLLGLLGATLISSPAAATDPSRLTILPAFPTPSDRVTITVAGFGLSCAGGPVFAEPMVDGETIRILGSPVDDPDSPCNPGGWREEFELRRLGVGTYRVDVQIGDGLYASKTFDVSAPANDRLVLHHSRFTVRVEWTEPGSGQRGAGHPVRLAESSGFFWFFSTANPEVMVKVLDGRSINGRYWVFIGPLTALALKVTVTDNSACINQAVPPCEPSKVYEKPAFDLRGIADLEAFRDIP